jgi:peptidoglycan/LPS O-acetylase OafA/YrhL
MGFVSYPLYLLHENMMVSLIVKTNLILPQIPSILLPAIPIMFVVGVAWLVAKFIDAPARDWLKKRHMKLQTSKPVYLMQSKSPNMQ